MEKENLLEDTCIRCGGTYTLGYFHDCPHKGDDTYIMGEKCTI